MHFISLGMGVIVSMTSFKFLSWGHLIVYKQLQETSYFFLNKESHLISYPPFNDLGTQVLSDTEFKG